MPLIILLTIAQQVMTQEHGLVAQRNVSLTPRRHPGLGVGRRRGCHQKAEGGECKLQKFASRDQTLVVQWRSFSTEPRP